MTTKETLAKIDHVFLKIKTMSGFDTRISYNYIANLFVNTHPEIGINNLMLENIVNKLINDGYLTLNKAQSKDDVTTFNVTFEGQLFDGYVDKWEKENAEKQRVLALEETNKDIINKTYILNKWVMGTAIVSAISALASAFASLYPILKVK